MLPNKTKDAGYTIQEAIQEAKRCLKCARPQCRTGCPIENDIPDFIHALSKGNIGEASIIINEKSNLPAICSRVCPHEFQCEAHCILTKKQSGIKISKLERFVADFIATLDINPIIKPSPRQGKIAVIGSGPAGLTVAADTAKLGFDVTVFEAQPTPGGVLTYGIPEFRLSKTVVQREIKKIEALGVRFCTNILIGPDLTIDELFAEGYDAIFIGTGMALPQTLQIPGKDLPGVITALYFLRTVKLYSAGDVSHNEIPLSKGERVIVIGAGNVAMDAARTALRYGAKEVTVIYRAESDLIARPSELEAAKNEGVIFRSLINSIRYLGEDTVTGLEVEQLKLDHNGATISTGQTEIIPADKIMLAIGQRPAARIVSTTTGIDVTDNGYVITRERPYGMTTRAGVFAGGDVVHGAATVVLAMREAKKVASGIVMYIEAKKLLEECI